jgi:phosphoribosyl 1,2-cyclic phosphodiesterase
MADQQGFLIRFWGVRGSYPTPGPHTLRHGGNTSCVEVQAGGHTLIFDAGSGLIRLGKQLMDHRNGTALNLSLFLTHGHGDHLIGFPFFAPLFDPQTHLHLFGPNLAGQSIEQLVTPLMSPPYFPVDVRTLPSHRSFHTITDAQCIIWKPESAEPVLTGQENGSSVARRASDKEGNEVCVMTQFTTSHPLDGAVVYRIEYAGRSLVYATDVEWQHGCEDAFLDFVYGAEMATEAARAADVGELILFHHEPTYDDDQLDHMEAEARAHFAHTRSACEGMEINLLA